MDYEFAEWALEYHKKEADIAKRFKEFSAEQRQKINERKKMKSYKFKCKPKDFDAGRVVKECTKDKLNWFAFQQNSSASIVIHRGLLAKLEKADLTYLHEHLNTNWGYNFVGTPYNVRAIPETTAKELAEEFVKLLDDAEKVEYTVYHG